jgi:hypothetical protein
MLSIFSKYLPTKRTKFWFFEKHAREGSSRLGFIWGVYLPFLLVDMLHATGRRVRFLVVPFPCWWPASFGLFDLIAWSLVLALVFFSLPCLGAFFL